MNAKLIRIEKTEDGWKRYWYECVRCGKEYWLDIRTQRTRYCGDCTYEQQREYSKAYKQRKQQELIDKVLNDIEVEIKQGYCTVNNDYDRGLNYGLYMATQIINNYRGKQNEQGTD